MFRNSAARRSSLSQTHTITDSESECTSFPTFMGWFKVERAALHGSLSQEPSSSSLPAALISFYSLFAAHNPHKSSVCEACKTETHQELNSVLLNTTGIMFVLELDVDLKSTPRLIEKVTSIAIILVLIYFFGLQDKDKVFAVNIIND